MDGVGSAGRVAPQVGDGGAEFSHREVGFCRGGRLGLPNLPRMRGGLGTFMFAFVAMVGEVREVGRQVGANVVVRGAVTAGRRVPRSAAADVGEVLVEQAGFLFVVGGEGAVRPLECAGGVPWSEFVVEREVAAAL